MMPRVVLFSPWKWGCAQSRSWVCFLKEKGEKLQIWEHSWAGTPESSRHIWIQLCGFFTCSTALLCPPSCGDRQWPSHKQPFAISLHSQPLQVSCIKPHGDI